MKQQNHPEGSDDARLDSLFEAYRAAWPDPEPSASFMPRLWQKIEAREHTTAVFGRLARNLVTAALALSTLLALAVSVSPSRVALPSESYVEVLAEDHASQDLDYFEPVHFSPAAGQH